MVKVIFNKDGSAKSVRIREKESLFFVAIDKEDKKHTGMKILRKHGPEVYMAIKFFIKLLEFHYNEETMRSLKSNASEEDREALTKFLKDEDKKASVYIG